MPPTAPPTPEAASTGGPHVVTINAQGFAFDVTTVAVKAGETVRFVIANGDDEKHNLVGLGDAAHLLSPDVASGQTVTYDWTAPATPVTFDVICAYHPKMKFQLVVQ